MCNNKVNAGRREENITSTSKQTGNKQLISRDMQPRLVGSKIEHKSLL